MYVAGDPEGVARCQHIYCMDVELSQSAGEARTCGGPANRSRPAESVGLVESEEVDVAHHESAVQQVRVLRKGRICLGGWSR